MAERTPPNCNAAPIASAGDCDRPSNMKPRVRSNNVYSNRPSNLIPWARPNNVFGKNYCAMTFPVTVFERAGNPALNRPGSRSLDDMGEWFCRQRQVHHEQAKVAALTQRSKGTFGAKCVCIPKAHRRCSPQQVHGLFGLPFSFAR